MNDQFDELAKAMAQPLGRRAALKQFGIGVGLFALAALGLPNNAHARTKLGGIGDPCPCKPHLVCRLVGFHAVCTRPNGIG